MSLMYIFLFSFFFVPDLPFSKAGVLKNVEKTEIKEIRGKYSFKIFPGTKWCGAGDIAIDDNDIGYFNETDKCCREHDLCPMNIAGKETKYGLFNPDSSTRSHCDCDKKFYECLHTGSSHLNRIIGEMFFNTLRMKCFREKECLQGKTGVKSYEFVDGPLWLPTEDELKTMYRLNSYLEPELEIDPMEDDIIGD